MKQPPLVSVAYDDPTFDMDQPAKYDDAPVVVVGWLLCKVPRYRVASERLPDGAYRAITSIHPALIRKVQRLTDR